MALEGAKPVTLYIWNDATKKWIKWEGIAINRGRSFTLERPSDSEDLGIFFANQAVTITEVVAVLVGSNTPSVTWTVRHDLDRSASGNEVVTSGTTTTNTTSGETVTIFNDATIPANSHVWLETTAKSGTVDSISLSIFYKDD